MLIKIKSRFDASVLFTFETSNISLAVEAAIKSGADLSRADLYGANLSRANLYGANLSGANLSGANLSRVPIIDGGLRSDGYRFLLTNFLGEGVRIKAGCRNFALEEARKHWESTRGGTQLGNESLTIIKHMETLAHLRGWEL